MRTTALALLAALALLVAGCGSDSSKGKPIPASLATTLEHRLDVIQSQYSQGGGACTDILDKTRPVVEADLQRLPSSVDPKVRDALRQSFDHLFQLTQSQCQDHTNTDTTPTDTNTTPTDTNTTPTDTKTTPTDTNTTPTDTNTTPQNVPPGQQKKSKKQKGNGNVNGDGNGGGPAAPGGG